MGRPDQDLWVPTIPSVPADLEFVSRRRCEDGVMALRFLYLFFLRVGQLIRLSWLDREELAVEVVMLRSPARVTGMIWLLQ